MFEQREQQGWFGTKWPLWPFVVLWFAADIPLRIFDHYIRDGFGLGWRGEIVTLIVTAVAVVAVAQYYRSRKQRARSGN